MTTWAGARSEAIAALVAAGVRASANPGGDAPYVMVMSEGTADGARVLAGQMVTIWTLRCVGGAMDDDAAASELDTLKQTVLETLRDLAGWSVGSTSADTRRDWQGGGYLTADVSTSRIIDI